MPIHKFHTEQLLNVSIEEAWDFFSSPGNLPKITPSDLDFKIITQLERQSIFPGMHIEYRVKPLLGIPVKWITIINDVVVPHHFTDKQLKGPYKLWLHSHTFTETEDGILMTDDVYYQLPFGIIGEIAHRLFVRKRIEEIFSYRYKVLEKIFNYSNELVS